MSAALPAKSAELIEAALSALGLEGAAARAIRVRKRSLTARIETPELLLKVVTADRREALKRSLQLTAWLEAESFPTPAPASEPVPAAGAWAALWRWQPHDPDGRPDPEAAGAALARLHRLLELYPLPLPPLGAVSENRRRMEELAASTSLDPALREFVLARARKLNERLQAFSGELGSGGIHGDLTLNNILSTPTGPVLVDFEQTAVGPREWDLALLARAKGWSGDEWPAFCSGYGYDITSTPSAAPLLEQASMRSLLRMLSGASVPAALRQRGERLAADWMASPRLRADQLDWSTRDTELRGATAGAR